MEFNVMHTKNVIMQLKVSIINNKILRDLLDKENELRNHIQDIQDRLVDELIKVQDSIPKDMLYQFEYGNLLDVIRE